MKRMLIAAVVIALGAGGYFFYTRGNAQADTANAAAEGGGRGGRGGRGAAPRGGGDPGFGGGGFGGGFGGGGRGPGGPRPTSMTVELGAVKRADMSEQVTVVGNLIGAATVEAVARVPGRLDIVYVKLGDSVKRGQEVAKVEDREIVEQIKQAQASHEVSAATIRQRDADLRAATAVYERNKTMFERQLISKQQFDDAEARLQASTAQLDLSRAQLAQATARLDELKLSLGNTVITSPVNGFVSKRMLDPGAWVTNNTSFMSFVDISTVRLVANIVEKDLRRINRGLTATVGVDAYPGESFNGRIARISPVLDPATRTAQIEVEIDNAQYRLKPGMYAKVNLTVEHHPNALVVPTNSLVDLGGKRGVFKSGEGDVARFHPVEVGLTNVSQTEVASGLAEGEKIVTTGAGALREGDKLLFPGAGREGGGRAGGAGRSAGEGGGSRQGGGGGGREGGGRRGGGEGGGQRGPGRGNGSTEF